MEPETLQRLMNTIYEHRVIVLLEDGPQSNKYNQILLTPEQFKAVSATIQAQFPPIPTKDGMVSWYTPIRTDLNVKLADKARTYYTQEDIDALQ